MKRFMNSSINRALIFQGGGSLGAYEAGGYKAINEDLSAAFKQQTEEMSRYSISYLERQ